MASGVRPVAALCRWRQTPFVRLLAELTHSVCPAFGYLANAAPRSHDPALPSSFRSSLICFKLRRCLRGLNRSIIRDAAGIPVPYCADYYILTLESSNALSRTDRNVALRACASLEAFSDNSASLPPAGCFMRASGPPLFCLLLIKTVDTLSKTFTISRFLHRR